MDEELCKAMPTDEPWVGTWRPHKPRGPIAALYGSPGPKYALPGLLGTSQHDPTKWKAPVFSFGLRYEEKNMNCSPGPRYQIPSNITRRGRTGTPAFSLQGRPKQQQLFKAPGPGEYSPELSGKMTIRSAPAYSLSGRRKEVVSNFTPGPATYTLPPVLGSQTVITPSAPTYTLCGRTKTGSFHEDLKKTPGPAAYKVVDMCFYRQKPPQYTIKSRHFGPDVATDKPGPGAHYPERVTFTRTKAPSFSFGIRHSQYISPFTARLDKS